MKLYAPVQSLFVKARIIPVTYKLPAIMMIKENKYPSLIMSVCPKCVCDKTVDQ